MAGAARRPAWSEGYSRERSQCSRKHPAHRQSRTRSGLRFHAACRTAGANSKRNWAATSRKASWPRFTRCATSSMLCWKAPPAARRLHARTLPDGKPYCTRTPPIRRFSISLARIRSSKHSGISFPACLQVIALDRFKLKVSGLEKLPKTGAYILSLQSPELSRSGRSLAVGLTARGFRESASRSAPAKFSAPASCASWPTRCG